MSACEQLARLLAGPQAPAAGAIARLHEAIEASAQPTATDLEALLSVLRAVHHSSALEDHEHAEGWLPAIEAACIGALTAIGAQAPYALATAYEAETSLPIRDALCEAAGKCLRKHPSLLALLTGHLRANSFVAALSLATYGDASASGAIVAQLELELGELEHPTNPTAQATYSSQAMVRVEGMLEALEQFDVPPTPELQARLLAQLGRERGKLRALASWMQRRQADQNFG